MTTKLSLVHKPDTSACELMANTLGYISMAAVCELGTSDEVDACIDAYNESNPDVYDKAFYVNGTIVRTMSKRSRIVLKERGVLNNIRPAY